MAPECVPSEIEVHYGPANRGGLNRLVLIVEGYKNGEFELQDSMLRDRLELHGGQI